MKSQRAYPLVALLLLLLAGCAIQTDETSDTVFDAEILPFLDEFAEIVAIGIEILGIGIIAKGSLTVGYAFARDSMTKTTALGICEDCREHLGHTILLGLEFLVAADIVRTVAVHPTFHNLGLLGVLVLIRTFLSFTLEIELQGCLPWKSSERLNLASQKQQTCSITSQPPSKQ